MQDYGVAAPGYPATLNTYNIPVTASWARDGRDSALIPSKGSLQQLSAEVGTPLGNMMFYRLFGQYQKYHSFTKGNICLLMAKLGTVRPMVNTRSQLLKTTLLAVSDPCGAMPQDHLAPLSRIKIQA
jgi:outer membrane protein assembly factor BamA